MSQEFKREERYIVIKRKDLRLVSVENILRRILADNDIPTRECVVVESDWPEYEIVWGLIEARMTGKPNAIEALAARLEQLRDANKLLDDALKESHPNGSFGKVFVLWNKAREALTTDEAGILAERDARTLEHAASIFRGETPFNFVAADGYSNGFDIASELVYMASELRVKAAELTNAGSTEKQS